MSCLSPRGKGKKCANFFVIFLNILWMVLGLIFIAIGSILKTEVVRTFLLDYLNKNVLPLIDEDMAEVMRQTAQDYEPLFEYMSLYIATPMIVFGIIVFILCGLGCFGGCFSPKLLLIYGILLCILVACQIATIVGVVVAKGHVQSHINSQYEISVKQYYVGLNFTQQSLNDTNLFTILANSLMVQGHCCGLENGEVFLDAKYWDRKFGNYTLKYPVACCKLQNTAVWPDISGIKITDLDGCVKRPTPRNSNQDTPCWTVLDKIVDNHLPLILTIVVIAMLIQIILIILAFSIYQTVREEQKLRRGSDFLLRKF